MFPYIFPLKHVFTLNDAYPVPKTNDVRVNLVQCFGASIVYIVYIIFKICP